MENIDLINTFIKVFSLNLITFYSFYKLININENKTKKILISIIFAIILSILYISFKKYFIQLFLIIILFLIELVFLKVSFPNVNISFISLLISNAFSYISLLVAFSIELLPRYIFNIQNKIINMIIISILEFIIIILFFKIKRFKDGFNFLKRQTEISDLIMFNISSIIIFIYTIASWIEKNDEAGMHLFISLSIICFIMFNIIQKTLVLNYKQKLLEKTIKDYEEEIKQKNKIITEKTEENFKFSKINHEFYNRQKSLQLAVNEFVNNNNLNSEASEELISNIENLTKEYSEKQKEAKSLNQLPKTEILEIDNMFKYMQEEANKSNIEFNLQINGNIFYMINNIIPENLLTTLIGDHIRDAIIAINSSDNKYKNIMAILGIKEKYYELCIYDSGIEFEIDTLLKLGLEQVTTHKGEGGTGIGFVTTFETLNKTKASLIIEEKGTISENDYTKAVIIRFDNKNEYKIKSYRAEEIKKHQKDNRIIIENI